MTKEVEKTKTMNKTTVDVFMMRFEYVNQPQYWAASLLRALVLSWPITQ